LTSQPALPPLRPTLQLRGRCGLTWDQTRLPFERIPLRLESAAACVRAIASMQVRGAPLIGAVAALGMAFAFTEAVEGAPCSESASCLLDACAAPLLAARPTAVNLAWAVTRVRVAIEASMAKASAGQDRAERAVEAAWAEVAAVVEADTRVNLAIGRHGQEVLLRAQRENPHPERPLQILTHCNAGALATVDWGTATAPLYLLHAIGVALHVWVDETRPRNQGASLTAFELGAAGIRHTVIADNAGGLLMMRGAVDAVIVGCDRVCANGDVINKIGTYLKALAAHAHNVPFWVACPSSTIDHATPSGLAAKIEERSDRELTHFRGIPEAGPADGTGTAVRPIEVRIMSEGQRIHNPGFDITPARWVSGLITEFGVVPAHQALSVLDYAGRSP
jgi:methylthioribose-1-phosphate isomerase